MMRFHRPGTCVRTAPAEHNRAACIRIFLASICILLAPGILRGADMGIGASARYSWWDPYWSQMADTRVFPGTRFEFNVLPRIKLKSNFSGGPLLNVGINDTWGLYGSYAYGEYEGTATGLLFNPLYYFIEQPVTTKRTAKRHEFNFLVSARIHTWVSLYGGIAYSGYSMHTEASVYVPEAPFFYSAAHRIFHHLAGPAIGVDFIIPLVPNLYLIPGCSVVFQFSSFVGGKKDIISDTINSMFMGAGTTLLYAGMDCALSLAYCIRQIGVTVAVGGRFHYLWIKDIGKGNFAADNKHDMLGGVNMTFMYSFNLTKPAAERREGPVLPKLQ